MTEAKNPPGHFKADATIDLTEAQSSGTLVARLFALEQQHIKDKEKFVVDLLNLDALLGSLSREREFQLYAAIAQTKLKVRFPDLEDFDQSGIRKMYKMLLLRRKLASNDKSSSQARYQLPEDDGFTINVKSNRAALKRKQRAELDDSIKKLRDKVVALKLIGYKETEIERYFQKRDAEGKPVGKKGKGARMPNTGVEIRQASINKLFKAYKDYNERIYSGGRVAGTTPNFAAQTDQDAQNLFDIRASSNNNSNYFVKSKKTEIELVLRRRPIAPFFVSFTLLGEEVPSEVLYVQPHQLKIEAKEGKDTIKLRLDIVKDDTVLTIGKYRVNAFFDPQAVEATTCGNFQIIIGQEFVSIDGISPIRNHMSSTQDGEDSNKTSLNYLITDHKQIIKYLKLDQKDIVRADDIYNWFTAV